MVVPSRLRFIGFRVHGLGFRVSGFRAWGIFYVWGKDMRGNFKILGSFGYQLSKVVHLGLKAWNFGEHAV